MPGTRLDFPWWILLGSAVLACGGDDGGTNPPPRVPTTVNQTGNNQTGAAGAALAAPISVTVLDQDGDPMSGVSVTFAVTAGGGSLGTPNATTNSSGVASTIWTLGSTAGSNNNQASVTVTGYGGPIVGFMASATAGAATQIGKTAGDAQTAEVAQAVPVAPKVLLRDALNNPVVGATVAWTVLTGGGSVGAATSLTDAGGEATIAWTLGPQVGSGVHSLRASLGALNATFTGTGVLTAGVLSLNGGDNQSAPINSAVATTPSVLVRTPGGGGVPVGGATVNWAVTSGGGSTSAATSVTNASGIAAIGWTLGGTPGANNQGLSATVTGLTGSPVAFVASATQPPTQMALQAGDGQTGTAGQALAQPLVVVVRDASNAPVAGVTVAWQVTAGGGSLTGATSVTNGSGQALIGLTAGTTAGTNNQTVTASVSGLSGSPVSFTASVVAAAAAQVALSSGNNQTATVGTALAQPIAVIVRDQYNNAKSGVTVNWAAAQGSVSAPTSVTDAAGLASIGWTIGTVAGSNNQAASATVAGLAGSPVTFTASGTAGAAATLAIAGGNNQSATVGSALPTPLAALVTDAYGNGVGGVSVSWTAATGGGSMAAATTQTGVGGAASNTWTLGSTVGGQTATASVAGTTPAVVTFSATGTALISNYTITLRYLTAISPARQAVFDAAAARWASIIVGDVADITINQPAGTFCGPTYPAINETIDDVLIFVTLDSIDGPNQILGSAGPCARRSGTRFSAIGQMRFDTADVVALENGGLFPAVILHEMGHVLGAGTLWNATGLTPLLINPVSSGGTDPYFNGPLAQGEFTTNGGGSYVGPTVPVEAGGGSGTRDSHWRESVMGKELMTGYVSQTANPLSTITIASLQDMGYTVSYVNADPYTVDGTNLRAGAPADEFQLREMAPDWTIRAVDSQGRIVGQR